MNKGKKETKPCSLRMNADLFDEFEMFCEDTRLSKTAVIEEGIKLFMHEYKAKMNPEAKKNED